MKNRAATKLAVLGMLSALMLVLGYLEYLLPVATAVPGIKLGLSNTVLIYSLYLFAPQTTFLLMGVKVLLSGLLFGGVSAMMYSFAGGFLSLLGMLLLRKSRKFSIVGISVAGAVLHSVGQVLLAMWILRTNQLIYYMAVLMLTSAAAGCLTGIAADRVLHLMRGKAFQQAYTKEDDLKKQPKE